MIFEAAVMPLEAAKIWATAYVDTNSGRKKALTAIDIAASYKLGATNVILGYIIDGWSLGAYNFGVPIYGDNASYKTGFYFGFDCSF
jgi:hypothetical protein